ncbi:MAG: lysophospholipid acyltransferase family protein [Planctomycetota bacterium]
MSEPLPAQKRHTLAPVQKRVWRGLGTPFVRYFGPIFLRIYSKTWRYRVLSDDPEHLAVLQERGCLAVLWHGRGLSCIPLFRGTQASILVSQSKDGQIMGDMLRGFGFETIDGSKSAGGTEAIRKLIGILKGGRTICLTPDGPRGPKHKVGPGAVLLSRSTRFPILPVGLGVNRAWHLNNWDSYTIPKPFAKVVSFVGAPIQVPRKLEEAEEAEWEERIREALMDAERRAFAELGLEPDW